ncbi:MAG: hypothetical protein HXY35_17460 [Chloroflexi bacterium]|nr:hypothetical protein [Chloroflexota bacterium]
MKLNTLLTVFLLITLAIVLGACDGGENDPAKQATLDAISASVRQTATVVAAQEQNPNAPIETAKAEATIQAQVAAATQGALDALSADAQSATATAVAPILAELPKYGVDPTRGRMGWIHPPVSLDVEGYMQYDYVNYFIATLAQDFVVSADITWNTQYGTSGCGFVLRSDGRQDALSQYLVIATRGASGHVLFATMSEGDVVTGQDIYAYGIDPSFQAKNDTTNRLTVVGRADRFWIYTNGTLVGEVDPSSPPPSPNLPPEPKRPADESNVEAMAKYLAQKAEYDAVVEQIQSNFRARQRAFQNADKVFERGFVALVALSESGRTSCQFDNGWLWLIE